MKIIKKGKVKPNIFNVKCRTCNSELEYEAKDVFDKRDGDYIICPVCNAFIGHFPLRKNNP